MNWNDLSQIVQLKSDSNITYSEYRHIKIDEEAKNQINMDVPRTVHSLYCYVLQDDKISSDDELPLEPIQKYMEMVENILLAYAAVRLK